MAPKMSKAEAAFRAKYPHTRTTEEKSVRTGLTLVTVYAGDYLCADGFGRAEAFKKAVEWEEAGLITPDPEEKPAPFEPCKHTGPGSLKCTY